MASTSKKYIVSIFLLCGFFCCFNHSAVAADVSVGEPTEIQNDSQLPNNTLSIIASERWSLHGQFTHVTQFHPEFRSPYSGQNSLAPGSDRQSTNDLTLFAGLRLWQGGAVYINPEIDQGFGLSNTLGLAGFSSGSAYKVGVSQPYLRIHRFFLRQSIGLGGTLKQVDSLANQLGGTQMSNNVTLTIGKFSVTDIFDTNKYAHDPRTDFLNWSIIDAGAFDYAADAWGYTYGTAAEWTQNWWTLRGGVFTLSKVPNSRNLDTSSDQYALIGELEERHTLLGHDGKLKVLGFVNYGKMASYRDALQLANITNNPPDVSLSRHYDARPGIAVNLEQEITSYIGLFARASINDGSKEAYEFTDINKSVSAGLSLMGNLWNRPNDAVGFAAAVNGLSSDAKKYFAAGGMGILVGDGQLLYGGEKIIETYYSARLIEHLTVALDYQYVENPAYNRDRGPVSIFGLRIHGDF